MDDQLQLEALYLGYNPEQEMRDAETWGMQQERDSA